MQKRRSAVLAGLSALALAVAAPAAEAKIWFHDLGGRRVEPFALVETTMSGCQTHANVCIPGISGFPAYAVPARLAVPRSCRAAARQALAGRLTASGVLRFRAPRQIGAYRLVIGFQDGNVCRPISASKPFRVIRSAARRSR